jgi:hypothetical protein
MSDAAHLRSIYRRLWRAGHIAVQNHGPQKYQVRSKIRHAFGTETTIPTTEEIDNTEEFLWNAGRKSGLEALIVENLCHVDYVRSLGKFELLSINWANSQAEA